MPNVWFADAFHRWVSHSIASYHNIRLDEVKYLPGAKKDFYAGLLAQAATVGTA